MVKANRLKSLNAEFIAIIETAAFQNTHWLVKTEKLTNLILIGNLSSLRINLMCLHTCQSAWIDASGKFSDI